MSVMTPASVLKLDSLKQLRMLSCDNFAKRRMSEEEIRHIFKICDALWLHSGDPKDPHAELTSGKCSDGFVNVLQVLRHTNLCEVFAGELIKVVKDHPNFTGSKPFDWVIGSDHAGATLSFEIARQLGAQHDFTEKDPREDNKKRQTWKRFQITPTERVLRAEELITTTRTLKEVTDALRRGNEALVNFHPLIGVLVHRSDATEFDCVPIVYVIHFDIRVWDPAECPLCKAGSKPIRPKTNWNKLIANNGA